MWIIEHFGENVLVYHISLRIDYCAFLKQSLQKTAFSRLFRWVDLLLPYSFEVPLLAGRLMDWADNLSRGILHYTTWFSVAVFHHVRTILLSCERKAVNCIHISANETAHSLFSSAFQNNTRVQRVSYVSVAPHSLSHPYASKSVDLFTQINMSDTFNKITPRAPFSSAEAHSTPSPAPLMDSPSPPKLHVRSMPVQSPSFRSVGIRTSLINTDSRAHSRRSPGRVSSSPFDCGCHQYDRMHAGWRSLFPRMRCVALGQGHSSIRFYRLAV